MKTHNNTTLTDKEIKQLKFIGESVNNWRQRNICLYEHPLNPERVISIGITFDKSMCVIADETRSEWATELNYIAHGKIYIRQ